jgi:hypothetical protein
MLLEYRGVSRERSEAVCAVRLANNRIRIFLFLTPVAGSSGGYLKYIYSA